MRITRIEIFGFKSFMDRLVLPLEDGITGVVGPNGCGKSNIVDALRWVMGETRARNLRGGTLEDVIFNGTDKLRPLGLAEVSVTLRASGSDFFSDVVSPALEAELAEAEEARIAKEEIAAQKNTGEADDSLESGCSEEPGEDGANARPHLTVIDGNLGGAGEKGATDQPQDCVEAQQGSSVEQGEDSKGSDPEAGAEPVSATLVNRFAWLKSANEVQVTRRLYRSGESEYFINRVPCRLKDIKEFFNAVGVGAKAHTIVAQGEVARIVTAKPNDRRLILEEAAGVLGFRDKIAAADRRLESTRVNISRVEDILKEVSRQVNSLRRQAARARNRQKLKDRIAELELQVSRDDLVRAHTGLSELISELVEAENSEQEILAKLHAAQADEESARSELIGVDVEGDRLRARIDACKEEINSRARQRTERSSRINELQAFVLSRTTEIERMRERRTTLQERRSEGNGNVERLEKQYGELKEQLAQISAADDNELKEITTALSGLRDSSRLKETELRKVRDEVVRCQGKLEAHEKQLIAASPVQQIRETLGESASAELQQIARQASLFIEGLRVPEEIVPAVQAVLAERSEFIVSDDPYGVAEQFIRQIDRHDPENSKGLALGVFKCGDDTPDDVSAEGVPFDRLIDKISIQTQCRRAAYQVFNNVYLVASATDAFNFFNRADGAQSDIICVTPQGDLITACSFYSLRNEGGVLHIKQKVEDLRDMLQTLETREAEVRAACKELQTEIATAEQRHGIALKESQERQARARELSKEQGGVRGRLEAERRVLSQVEEDLNKTEDQEQESRRRISEYEEERTRVEEELQALVPEEEGKLHETVRELNERYLTLDEQRREGRTRLSQLSNSVNAVRSSLDSARSSQSNLTLKRQKLEIEAAHSRQRVLEEYGECAWEYCLGNVTDLAQVLAELRVHLVDQNDESSDGERDTGEVLSEIEAVSSNTALASDSSDAGADVAVFDGFQAGDDADALAEEVRAAFKAEVTKLRNRVMREGDVDPTSIERFEEEKERLDNLEEQKTDLERAALTLRKTIERLKNTSEQRFVATFEAISRNFSDLAPRLFGGGSASLELTAPENPLESGVSIIARPPGKKLKSIDLMSGGEKALCATALIFAMFLERPSPLCVLDEVDAPLDDANLVRFLSLIKEMSNKTQFLLITHNKGSMAVADKLVGVTMQEPGASTVLTVSLQEAYSQVA